MSSKWIQRDLGNNIQEFIKGDEHYYAPTLIGDRYSVDGILSTSGGFGIIFTAKDLRMLGRKVLVKARRYDGEPGLFSYPNDNSRADKIDKIRDQIEFECDCLLAFKRKGESRMPNVNDLVYDFSPFLYGPHKAADGNAYYLDDKEIFNTEPYIVMQMIGGVNLGEYVDQGIDYILKDRGYEGTKFWEHDVLQYALDLCTIFQEFHKPSSYRNGNYFIYQDLKPENIIITDNTYLTLLDFGGMTLVKEQNGATSSNWEGYGSPGLGTWGYKAPEMDETKNMLDKLDSRVDIYALGATLYHLLTGDNLSKPPHEEFGEVPIEKLKQYRYTSETIELITIATKYNREDRYESMPKMKMQAYKAITALKRRR